MKFDGWGQQNGGVIVMGTILKAVFLYRLRSVLLDFLVLRKVRPKPSQESCKEKPGVTEPAETS